MDTYLEPDPEISQGWEFNLLDQSYLQMFGLPDEQYPLDHSHMLFSDSFGMEDSSYTLDCNVPGIDMSSSSNSETLYGIEAPHLAEIDCHSPRGSQSSMKSESPTSKMKNAATPPTRDPRMGILDEFLVEFEIFRPTTLGRNHRRSYRPEKRRKVEQVRKAGACLRCRLLKRPVSCFLA
jgi:hypothetical protein